jgi:hypothetical protein
MNVAAGIVSVRRVTDDVTECRRCQTVLSRGRRVAFVVDVGNVCLPCLAGQTSETGDTYMTSDTTAAADDEHDDDGQAEVITIGQPIGTPPPAVSTTKTTPPPVR